MKIKRRGIFNILIGLVVIFGVLTFYSTFSLDTSYVFKSKFYDISNDYINGISPNTSIELYNKYFDMDNCYIKVVDLDNNNITSGYVINGSKTILYDNNDNVMGEFINIIKGDINRDGIVDSNDFYDMGKCLVDNCDLDEDLEVSLDIDLDGKFLINDLMLLDKAVTLGYSGISVEEDSILLQSGEKGRVVARVEPNYGINFNVRWSSDDEEVATVDESGVVTGGIVGSTIVRASTMDGKFVDEVNVTIDNTPQLDSYEGVGYIGGKDVFVGIKAVNYDDLTCSVSNSNFASCSIKDKRLVLKANSPGEVEVKVISASYGEVVYKFESISVYLNVMPKYVCMTPNSSTAITVSSFDGGELSFDIRDKEIVKNTYMDYYGTRKMLRIDSGTKQGRTTFKVTESNANTSNIITVDVSYISVQDMSKFTKAGEEVSTTILGENLGELSCSIKDPYGNNNDNNSLGICEIRGNELIVKPTGGKELWVNIYNKIRYNNELYDCGSAMFSVFVNG